MSGAVRQILIKNDPDVEYFLRVDWSGDLGAGFTIVLTNGSTAWIGEVSEEEITKGADDTGMSRERYVQELRRALMQDESKRETTKYVFQLNSDQLFYQRMSDNGLVNLGSVELQPAPDPLELNREMIGQSLKRHLHLEATNSQLLQENCKLRQEHSQILKELETCTKTKIALEKQMYSRFVMILNEKKSRIRELQEAVRTLQQNSDHQPQAKVRRQRDPSNDENSSADSNQDQYSQEPTIIITGRNLVCHGIPVDQSSSETSQQQDPET